MYVHRLLLFALIAACPASDASTPITTDPSTTLETSTTPDGTTTPTSGIPPDLPSIAPEEACLVACEARAQCLAEPVPDDCVPNCINGLGHGGGVKPECISADTVLTAGQATLDCDADAYRDPDCNAQFRAMLAACRVCQNTGGPLDPDGCYTDVYCSEGLRRMECRGETCVCTFDGAFVKTCPSEGCSEGWPITDFDCCS